MNLENEPLINLCNIAQEKSKRIKEITIQVDDLLEQINSLNIERNQLIMQKQPLNNEFIRRKLHDLGGALTAIQRNAIDPNSIDIFESNRSQKIN